ncbi:MAG: hypothetical protein ACE5MG_11840 [Candidatus Methylomirabilales bacterium]
MKDIGILAYGSLIEDAGGEIEPVIVERLVGVETPFNVEFARTSRGRDGAPTLVPVEKGGTHARATIFVLRKEVSEAEAKDMLWRRETDQVGSARRYAPPARPGPNTVCIERLVNFRGISAVLYTSIAPNITPLTPQTLAELAIQSCRGQAGEQGRDGISYLLAAKRNGITTPLMGEYEGEILRRVGAETLEGALSILCRGHQ